MSALANRPLVCQSPVPSDIAVSQSIATADIAAVGAAAGVLPSELELHGPHKAKITLACLERLADAELGHYVVVTGINPTPLGEGKSTTTVGLCQALQVRARCVASQT